MYMQARLPLNNLNIFASAAECLSFQDAADRLHVTPSAVSHQIRNLEGLLGYKLFERADKRVKLTPRGEQLFADVRGPLQQIHEASRKALRSNHDNVLTLSVAPLFATRWLLPRMKDFRASHPEINLSVIATTEMVDFRSEPIDASIRLGGGDWPGTQASLLFTAEMVAVCCPSLLKRNGGLFDPAQLMGQNRIDTTAMPGLWTAWLASAGISDSANKSGLEVENSAQLMEAVQSDDGVGLVDLNLIGLDLEAGRVALACRHVYRGEGGYYLTSPEPADPLPSLDVFREWLFAQVQGSSVQNTS